MPARARGRCSPADRQDYIGALLLKGPPAGGPVAAQRRGGSDRRCRPCVTGISVRDASFACVTLFRLATPWYGTDMSVLAYTGRPEGQGFFLGRGTPTPENRP